MNQEALVERITEFQNEILSFTWEQVGDKADKFYVQGKVTDDEFGNITSVEGNCRIVVANGQVMDVSEVINDDEFISNARFVKPRISEMHDLLLSLQGKSPVRLRWSVDTQTGQVESEWTYYADLSEKDRNDDWWQYWDADFAWTAQVEADHASEQ